MSRFFYRYPTFLKSILTSVYIAKYVPNGIGMEHNEIADYARSQYRAVSSWSKQNLFLDTVYEFFFTHTT
jgi:hypothetical protein